jgi:gliding motility-associated lipoprotein GldH
MKPSLQLLFKYGYISLMFLGVLLVASCDHHLVHEENHPIPEASWEKDHVLSFRVDMEDTLQAHHISINVRNTSAYPMSNLFLFVSIVSPDGLFNRDTIQFHLAEPSGKWVGKGFGSIYSNRFRYKNNVRFPVTGSYHFTIEHGMRTDRLEGISDVGLRIEVAPSK